MVLLNPYENGDVVVVATKLTFHYGAIEPNLSPTWECKCDWLTFHYGAIEPR